jgi:DNA ligase-1
MKSFAKLISSLDASNSTNDKKEALVQWFNTASEKDKIWPVALFTHRRPKRAVKTSLLRMWAAESAGIPLWLFEESYHIVGDLAEAITLILPKAESGWPYGLDESMRLLHALHNKDEEEKKNFILNAWNSMSSEERFVFNKLITGGFRIGVSEKLIQSALAIHLKKDSADVAFMLTGNWDPLEFTFQQLIDSSSSQNNHSKPYPFYLAYPLEDEAEDLGDIANWQLEWKWDGIRAQLIHRNNEVHLWSRGEELISQSFPEIIDMGSALPQAVVLDGELMAWKDGHPLPFQALQKRLGRKKPGRKTLSDTPVALMVYDLLEWDGKDIRNTCLQDRRALLEDLVKQASHPLLLLSNLAGANDWNEAAQLRKNAREHQAEGLMIKRKESTYQSGRKRGDWWKWKSEPYTLDLVLIYAQRGHGRRANLYTDFTFAARNDDGELITLTKAYSGLTDREFQEINRFIRANTIDSFGPVRSVKAELVFELAFEGINRSNRNKSGFALRFPRIKRWRQDKKVDEINSIKDVEELWVQTNHLESEE